MHNNKDPSWWNEEVKGALRNKKECFKQWQSSGLDDDRILYKTAKKLAKYKVAKQRNYSREKFYKRLENANNDRDIFKLAKQRHKNGLDIKINKYIKNENGLLLTEDNKINERWCQYYQKLLNEEFPSQPLNITPSVAGPLNKISEEEVKRALKKIKNHKAVGPDSIPADLWKLLGPIAVQWLTKLFNQILTSMKIPKSWRHSYLVPFYKNKGDVSDCGNYRGIKLTSHTLKLWERILNNRLCQLVSISDNQCGFAPGRSTTDAIQAIRILMEKHRTNREDLHLVFIDLEKAFDRIPRKLVWEAMRAQQIPELYIHLVHDMYQNISTQVRSLAGLSEPFQVKVGVHQGSALSLFLFNLSLDYLTKDIQSPLPWCMLYADDIVLIDKCAIRLQATLEQWRQALENNGLHISRSKTEFLRCSFSEQYTPNISVSIDGQPLPCVNKFKYLGSVLTADINIDADVTHRINAAWLRWRTLSGILCDSRMPIQLKGKIYKTAVRPAMLYGAECWAAKKIHEKKMHTNEMKMLRWSAGVTRLDKVRNEYIRGSFKVAPIVDKMVESRMRWYGHVMRREEEHPVRKALAIPEKKKGRGRPLATWWTTVSKDLERAQLEIQATQDRKSWRIKTRRADPK
ncbi:unnamed protein product [Parnassius mnemosyne]|uniref:Reverse transcriptase domain-containing protein n=1 Tax=Parnassius mnemosyne TaxID=213953 RepID=A0AAV1LJU1_9NEOP